MSEQEKTKTKRLRQNKAIDINDVLKKPFLNEYEVSAITGRAVSTLRNERHLRRGLPYLRVGARSIRYRMPDVLTFMEARPICFDDNARRNGGRR